MLRKIHKRLIVDYTFVIDEITVKALIDPKFYYSSISKALVKKMDIYISREGGSGFPEVQSMAGGIDQWSQEIDASIPRYARPVRPNRVFRPSH